MTANELFVGQQAIEKEIYACAETHHLATDSIDAISDGVADCAAYLNSSPRVAWILKEPYDDFESNGAPSGGGWSLPELLMKTKVWNVSTWQRVIYVMYGLEHGLHYSEMDWIREKPEMGDVMKKIAWLNLSKMPAGTTSSSSFATNFNSYWKEILKKQIDLYNPEIIVFGNTFSACRQLFGEVCSQPLEVVRDREGRCFINVFKDKGCLLLDAYHPGMRSDIEFYVDSLIDTINRHYSRPE